MAIIKWVFGYNNIIILWMAISFIFLAVHQTSCCYFLSIQLSSYLCIYLSILLYTYLSINQSSFLTICLFIIPYIYLSIYLYIYLHIYLKVLHSLKVHFGVVSFEYHTLLRRPLTHLFFLNIIYSTIFTAIYTHICRLT